MKIAFQNFLTTLRRYRVSSLLNVAGLTLAFAAFYIIMVQVWWEATYNRSVPESENVYVLGTRDSGEERYDAWVNRPIPERFIESTADVEAGAAVWGGGDEPVWIYRSDGGVDRMTAPLVYVSRPWFGVMRFETVAGDLDAVAAGAGTIAVSESVARRLRVGVGDTVGFGRTPDDSLEHFEIVAVYRDFADNTLMAGWGFVGDLGDRCLNLWSEWSFNYFLRLRPGADPHELERGFVEMCREMSEDPSEIADDCCRLQPLRTAYFAGDFRYRGPSGSRATGLTLLAIALLVIVVACINFVNFFFALIPRRIRTVNTLKVFGVSNGAIRGMLLCEALGLVAIALGLAWCAVALIQGTELASYVSTTLDVGRNLPVAGLVALAASLLVVVSSLYPSYYITSFPPAMVVKGTFAGTPAGRRLRTALVGVQFVVSIALIVGTGFVWQQYRFMMRHDMGFDRENLLFCQIPQRAALSRDALFDRLRSDPGVLDAATIANPLVTDGRMSWGRHLRGEQIGFSCNVVSWNFLRVMGIEVSEGRDFTAADERNERSGALIFNDCARREYGMTLDDGLYGFLCDDEPIVGFCRDFSFRSLQYGVEPLAFYILPGDSGLSRCTRLYVRTTAGADIPAVREHIGRCVAELAPDLDSGEIDVRFIDEELEAQYVAEQRLAVIVGCFSLLSIAIALMGVFGVVLFETQHRRREIALRKVMGATTGEVIGMFVGRYVRIVLVCFVVAVPVAWWSVDRWLSTFATRTPIVWWLFALALGVVLAVTVATVALRSRSAASENPAQAVKSE